MRYPTAAPPLAPLVLLGALACGDSAGLNNRPVSLSFASQVPAPAVAAYGAPSYSITVTEGANTLVITKAQLVLREIELKTAATATCADDVGADDCDEIELDPVLVDLPVTAGVVSPITASVPEGTYREIEFDIHKPGDDAKDLAFKAANPAFADISIRVEGTYNGQPFVFTSTANEGVELEFNPPVVIDASNNNVTITVDVGGWFRDANGNLINPATANPGQPNASIVASRIKASLDAFEDDDEDGQ